MKPPIASLLALFAFPSMAVAGLEPGDQLTLTIRGVDAMEQQKITGTYRIGESGKVRLPLLEDLVAARGLSPEQFARAVESAYKDSGIYSQPAIEIEVLQGGNVGGTSIITVGGQVRRGGEFPFRKDMTVIQAIDSAGGRNDFGGRNLFLIRDGKQVCLDFTNLAHKNIVLRPGDSIQVDQKAILDRWKGKEQAVKSLTE
ncbi:MAG: polysaccharide biosynthesis/export family protein [Verrucomicrobiota bacterium]